jgi:3-oxoacyl-[acyl-carrier-protein] synthase II
MANVVITGIGIVSPVGNDAELFEAALVLGRTGVRDNEWHDTTGFTSKQAGQVSGFEPPPGLSRYERRHCSLVDLYALAATREALERAELALPQGQAARTGVVLGSGGAVAETEAYAARAITGRARRASRLLAVNPDSAGAVVAAHYGLGGPRSSVMTACSSGATAVGFAADLIQAGYAEVMLAGGVESLSYVTLTGFNALGAMAAGKNRPFDRHRDGIVLGEAGAVMVLETAEHARSRGVRPLAELAGYGLTSDANHITAPHPEGDGMARAMAIALASAGARPEDIAYINAHGTGTELNDASETAAVRRVFGEHAYRLCMSSIKPMVGHTLSAAGAIEAAATVLALKGGFAPPTLNYEEPDPACDLDYVPNQARNLEMAWAMSNSLAFGGNNTSLVFKRWEEG